jgi:hypothetical protein
MARIRVAFVTGTIATSLALAQGGFNGPGRYEITNLKSNKLMGVDRNDQTSVIQSSGQGTDNQRWDIQPGPDGFYYIRNAMNGKALQVTANSNSAPLIRFDPGKDGNAMITSRAGGKTIDVPNGSDRDGLHLQIYGKDGDSNQRFLLRRVGAGAGFGGDRDRDRDRGRDKDKGFDPRGRDDRNRQPDSAGRFWDDREQMWKLTGDGACLYQEIGFRGDALCVRAGADIPDVGRAFRGPYGSVRFFGRTQAMEVFERGGFQGDHYRLAGNRDTLDRTRIGSFRVN